MSDNNIKESYKLFFDLIYKNFKLLEFENECFYHYWFGERDKIVKLFAGVSFPSITTLVKMGRLKEEKLLVICSSNVSNNAFYGAAIFSIKSKNEAELISFVINPEHRNLGYGTQLMRAIEKMCKLLKIQTIVLKYRTYWKSNEIWEKLLDKTGWSDAELQLWYFSMPDANTQFGKLWFTNAILKDPFSVEEWSENSYQKLQNTLLKNEWQNIVPKSLDPFQMKELVLPHASLLLKKDEEVVGWLICHMLQPNIVQITTVYVHPDKAKGQGMILMAEAGRRRKLGAKVVFMVEKHNKIMINLTNKYLTGNEIERSQLNLRKKQI